VTLRDGDVIEVGGAAIECVYTPGHLSNHLCFALREEKALFTGDHVMGWSTTVVAPPDGDMGDYLHSLRKLLTREDAVYWPTHGGPIRDPKPFLSAYIQHRLEREAQVLGALKDGIETVPALVERIYLGLEERLKPAASLTVLAHLIHLAREGRVASNGEARLEARFRLR
jgi:glyoxylase-like metal-dependent hydrolase (beta-lactamase superfamily II)